MSAANQLPHLMTANEFLTWEAPDGSDRWELIDGTPQAMAPSRPRHGRIAAETGRLLGNHLADHPRCSVVTEAGVKPDDYNLRIPDLRAKRPGLTICCCASRSSSSRYSRRRTPATPGAPWCAT